LEYSIGDFSKISRLGIKTLRYYHEVGLLLPTRIDKFSSYRYYDEKSLSRVQTIIRLKELDFPLDKIKEILDNNKDDQSLIRYMREQLTVVNRQIDEYGSIRGKIETFIRLESEIPEPIRDVETKVVPDVFIASVKYKGRYEDIGQHMSRLLDVFQSVIAGPSFCLYHDEHHADENMKIECCMPITRKIPAAGFQFTTLPGGRMVSIMHEGDYSSIWMSYQKIVDYMNKHDLPIIPPTREIYLRGAGMILPGDPEKYLTEIQFLFKDDEDPISKTIRKKIAINIHA
jgi:DNA-binding transcriptional MerR regulator